jgi:hypothetical protein
VTKHQYHLALRNVKPNGIWIVLRRQKPKAAGRSIGVVFWICTRLFTPFVAELVDESGGGGGRFFKNAGA